MMRSRNLTFGLFVAGAAILVVCLGAVYRAARAKTLAEPPLAHTRQAATASQQEADPNGRPTSLSFAADPEVVPPFAMKDLAGEMVSTAELKGKAIIINFWATWCGPCREEIPEMIALQSKYQGSLQIIGISEDDGPPDPVAKFVQKIGINYPVIMYTDALEKEYGGVSALPTSFLVNKDGRVVQKDVGVYPLEYYDMQARYLMGMPVNARIATFKDTGQIFLKNADKASQLPGVSFAGLTAAQKKMALRRLNSQMCTCGCQLTLAECRINDTTCPVSASIATKIVKGYINSKPAGAGAKTGVTR
jgi:thiol-disulfide isomerase/thioredoxin